MSTNREKYNKKYGKEKDASNSKADIVKTTGIPKSIIDAVYKRGIGAHKTNPSSVRNVKGVKGGAGQKMSKEQWAMGRVYGFVMKNPKQVGKGKPDRDLYEKMLKAKKSK